MSVNCLQQLSVQFDSSWDGGGAVALEILLLRRYIHHTHNQLLCLSLLQSGVETTEVCLLRQHLPNVCLTFWDLMEATVCL